jgi:hypothetical protein
MKHCAYFNQNGNDITVPHVRASVHWAPSSQTFIDQTVPLNCETQTASLIVLFVVSRRNNWRCVNGRQCSRCSGMWRSADLQIVIKFWSSPLSLSSGKKRLFLSASEHVMQPIGRVSVNIVLLVFRTRTCYAGPEVLSTETLKLLLLFSEIWCRALL